MSESTQIILEYCTDFQKSKVQNQLPYIAPNDLQHHYGNGAFDVLALDNTKR